MKLITMIAAIVCLSVCACDGRVGTYAKSPSPCFQRIDDLGQQNGESCGKIASPRSLRYGGN